MIYLGEDGAAGSCWLSVICPLPANPCRVRGAGSERSVERPIVGPAVVIELADAIGVRWRAVVLVAGFAGLRIGELIALRRKHVDLKEHSLTVAEQVVTLKVAGAW